MKKIINNGGVMKITFELKNSEYCMESGANEFRIYEIRKVINDKGEVKIKRGDPKHYSCFEHAVKSILDLAIRKSTAQTLTTLLEDYVRLKKELTEALGIKRKEILEG